MGAESERRKTRVNVEFEFALPILPNFLRAGDATVSIADLSDDAIRALGTEWTNALIEHAARLRKLRTMDTTP